MSHLESQVVNSLALKSGAEWKFWVETLVRYLVQEGLLFNIFDSQWHLGCLFLSLQLQWNLAAIFYINIPHCIQVFMNINENVSHAILKMFTLENTPMHEFGCLCM